MGVEKRRMQGFPGIDLLSIHGKLESYCLLVVIFHLEGLVVQLDLLLRKLFAFHPRYTGEERGGKKNTQKNTAPRCCVLL
jgi:hypothetical protein